MSRAQKTNMSNLKDEEIARRQTIMSSIMEHKETKKIDIKATFELIYLSFLPLLADRNLVEDDLKELKCTLDKCADQMLEIMKKSTGKTQK